MAEIAYDTGLPLDLPPLELPTLGLPEARGPLRIEITKRSGAPASGPTVGDIVRDWAPPETAPAAAPGAPRPTVGEVVRDWTPPARATSERQIGGGEATLRGLASGATFDLYPAMVGAYEAAKTGLGYGAPGESAAAAYERARQADYEEEQRAKEQHPYLFTAGQLGGGIAPLVLAGPLGEGAAIARIAIPSARTALGRIGTSALSGAIGGAGYGAGGEISRGGTPGEVLSGAGLGAASGGVLGGVGGGAIELATPAVRGIGRLYRGATDVDEAAQRQIAEAVSHPDTQAAIAQRLNDQAMQQAAQRAGTPVNVADVIGQPGGRLLRVAGNLAPEAGAAAREQVQARYAQQADRFERLMRSRFGNFDTEAEADALRAAARRENAPNYRRAEQMAERRHPRGIMSPKLEQLLGGNAVPAAMQRAAGQARDRSVAEGLGAYNPNVTFENGILRFNRQGGVQAYPDLRLWDYTLRELRGAAEKAAATPGERNQAAYLRELHDQLRTELDRLVPEFGHARGVAARHFAGQDAAEAGRDFVAGSMSDAAAGRALAQMGPRERELFARSFAAELVRRINEHGASRNLVTNQIFTARNAIRRLQVALGPQRSAELEAFIRAEQLVDFTRNAVVANSTTVQQLSDIARTMGLGALLGHAASAPLAILTAAIGAGAEQAEHRISVQVARRVAEMLLSDDPQVIQRAMTMAAERPIIRDALRHAVNLVARETVAAAGPERAAAGIAAQLPLPGEKPSAEEHRPDTNADEVDEDRVGGTHP